MNIYFDTEFTGLQRNADLISIGLIDEKGKIFYAEFNDFDPNKIDIWIQNNVIKNLMFNNEVEYKDEAEGNVFCKGNKSYIKKELTKWLDKYGAIQFVSDVSHYDFVLLIDLLSFNALELSNHIAPVCYDINQLIAQYYEITQHEAFNMAREEILNIKDNTKHNSLYDAKVIKKIYELMK